MKSTSYICCSDWFKTNKEECTIPFHRQQRKKKKMQPYTSPKKTTKTNTKKRTRNRIAPKKLSVKPKGQWAVQPTSTILVAFIKETFTSIVGKPSKLPINEFIKFYDNKMDQGWLKSIIGNLIPFITFLLSSIFASHTNNVSTSISFFESKLPTIPSSKYQQTKEDLFAAVKSSLANQIGGWDHHPLNYFLTTNHEVKRQFNNGWLLHLLCNEGAGKKYKGIVLESNVKCITIILYSIVCITRNKDAID